MNYSMNAAGSSVSFSRPRHVRSTISNIPLTSQAHGYREKIQRLLKTNALRLTVNINHLRIFNREYAHGLLSAPVDYLPACDKALNDYLHTLDPDYAPASIGLDGSFGLNAVRISVSSSYTYIHRSVQPNSLLRFLERWFLSKESSRDAPSSVQRSSRVCTTVRLQPCSIRETIVMPPT